MRLFVTTCDHYRHVVPAHVEMLNKYWRRRDGGPMDIVVLCFEQPENYRPPSNVEVVSLGTQPGKKIWTDPLMDYFSSISDPYFFHVLDDYILVKEVDLDRVEVLEKEVREGRADKASLVHHFCSKMPEGWPKAVEEFTVPYIYSDKIEPKYRDIVRMSPRTSEELPCDNAGWGKLTTCPSIWTRDYFLRYMERGQTIWTWSQRTDAMVDDGAVVIEYGDGNNVFNYLHLYTQGSSGGQGVMYTPQILGPRMVDVSEEDKKRIGDLASITIDEIGFFET